MNFRASRRNTLRAHCNRTKHQTTVNVTISGTPRIKQILIFPIVPLNQRPHRGPNTRHCMQSRDWCHLGEQCKDENVVIMIVVSPKIADAYLWRIFIYPHLAKFIFSVTLNLGRICGFWTFLSKQHSPNPPSFTNKYRIPIKFQQEAWNVCSSTCHKVPSLETAHMEMTFWRLSDPQKGMPLLQGCHWRSHMHAKSVIISMCGDLSHPHLPRAFRKNKHPEPH